MSALRHAAARGPGTLRAIVHEIVGTARIAAGPASFLRLAGDVLLYRVLKVWQWPWRERLRSVSLKEGVQLTYRLNRGDILALRETWIDEVYSLPFSTSAARLLDLGANIGLTSVWLTRRYGFREVIAVEPLAANAELLRRNLAQNGIHARVVEAAVGPSSGLARFAPAADHTAGRVLSAVGASGEGNDFEIRMVAAAELLDPCAPRSTTLKLDIEGGEGELLEGDRSWLGAIEAAIVEFHPWMVEVGRLVTLMEDSGFTYLPAGSAHPGSMDSFVRS